MTEAEIAMFLLKQAELGHGNRQHPDDDHDYGRKQLSKMLPNHTSVIEKLVELEITFWLDGIVGKQVF